ncbi:hypothetical protein QUA71_23075 [Microcoleus sp. MON1_C5]|uniref:hypothetical protein n=1 Tax=Microcoleus sp. MON1_C5 TaxID=2818828 RepID=UPI002FD546D8
MRLIYHKSISHNHPRNRVSSDISRTQLKIVAETRFLATQREKLDRKSAIIYHNHPRQIPHANPQFRRGLKTPVS